MAKQFRSFAHRQAYYARIAAVQTLHENRGEALYGIASGLVTRLTTGPVGGGFFYFDRAKFH